MPHLIFLFQSFIQTLRDGKLPQLGIWSYILLFLLVVMQGPVGSLVGAVAASAGLMKPGWVFGTAMAGSLTDDTILYSLGYFGKIDWLMRFGKKLGIHGDTLERLQIGMRDRATSILFAAILTMGMIIPALIAAGLVKAPWKRWFPPILIGELLWTGLMLLIGYYGGNAILRVEQGMEYAALGGAVIFVIFLTIAGRRFIKKQYPGEINPGKKD
jgi:membrane protein DedA with SNARE-associated domain